MFPQTNLQCPITHFQGLQLQMCQMYPQPYQNNQLFSFGSYCYFFQGPYFQTSFEFDQFSSPLLVPNEVSECLRPIREEYDGNTNKTTNEKLSSSLIKELKPAILRPQKQDTKQSLQNEGYHLMLRTDIQLNKVKMEAEIVGSLQQQYLAQVQAHKKKSEEHLYLKYRRKNTQSNIVNRIYTFLTTSFKNKKQVRRLGISAQKQETYLRYLLSVVQKWNKPVKRQLLFRLMNITNTLPAYKDIQNTLYTQKVLSLEQFAYLNRVLIKVYLTEIASVSVITSKKIKKAVRKQHLEKIRQLNIFFFQNGAYQQ